MTINPVKLTKDEESALLKVLDSAGFKLLTRIVAARRDSEMLQGAEERVLGNAFPLRKELSESIFVNAMRYHNFLEVVNEMIDPNTQHELIEIVPTKREEIKNT